MNKYKIFLLFLMWFVCDTSIFSFALQVSTTGRPTCVIWADSWFAYIYAK